MTRDLVLYTNPMSRGRIVRWMLEEIGVPYRAEIVDNKVMKSPVFLTINPMGKVPAITHGDMVVTECAAICAYLADAYPGAGLAPAATDPTRGEYYRWLFFGAGPLESAVTNKALGFEVPADKKAMAGYGSFADVLNTLEAALSGRSFIAGDRFSAADLYLGSHLIWGMAFGTIERRPAFEQYVAPLQARPAAIRASAIDDALIAAAKVAPGA